jgi:hypothetical protein
MIAAHVDSGNLESHSLWFRYKSEVWPEESPQRDVVHNMMRVLRSIRFKRFAYVSAPITSGKFLYELQLKKRCFVAKEQLMEEAIAHNYLAGWQLVEDLRKRRDCPILYPADLVPVHQQWEQSHFQALWLNIIAELCTEIHMCEGWELSNGGVEEFTHVMQLRLGLPAHPDLIFYNTKGSEAVERERMKNIAVYDHRGKIIPLQEGMKLIERAASWMRDRGFDTARLKSSLTLLRWTDTMIRQGFYQ